MAVEQEDCSSCCALPYGAVTLHRVCRQSFAGPETAMVAVVGVEVGGEVGRKEAGRGKNCDADDATSHPRPRLGDRHDLNDHPQPSKV